MTRYRARQVDLPFINAQFFSNSKCNTLATMIFMPTGTFKINFAPATLKNTFSNIPHLLCLWLCLIFFLFSRTQQLPFPAAGRKVPKLEYMWLLQKPSSHLPFVSHRGKFERVNTQPLVGPQFRFRPQTAAGCIWRDWKMLSFVRTLCFSSHGCLKLT